MKYSNEAFQRSPSTLNVSFSFYYQRDAGAFGKINVNFYSDQNIIIYIYNCNKNCMLIIYIYIPISFSTYNFYYNCFYMFLCVQSEYHI